MTRFQIAEVVTHTVDWLFGDIKRIRDEHVELASGVVDLILERRESPPLAVIIASGVLTLRSVEDARRSALELKTRTGRAVTPCVVTNAAPAAVRRHAQALGVEVLAVSVHKLKQLACESGLRKCSAA